jgi:hypothetical protein
VDASTKFGAGMEAISSKMVEQQLEGDKDVDLVFTTLWARPNDLAYFNFSSFSYILVIFFNGA